MAKYKEIASDLLHQKQELERIVREQRAEIYEAREQTNQYKDILRQIRILASNQQSCVKKPGEIR